MTKLKLSLKFKVNQDGHPKDAEKRSLYDDDFSLDNLHVDASVNNIVVADCFKLRHTTACIWDI